MTKKVKDLAVRMGSYEKNGATKGRYMNIGVVMVDDNGKEFILLDKTFNPAGVDTGEHDKVMVTIFDDTRNSNVSPVEKAKTRDFYPTHNDDDIPF